MLLPGESSTDIAIRHPKKISLQILGTDTDSFIWSFRISADEFNTLKRNEIIFWRLMYTFIIKHEFIDIHNLSRNHPLFIYNPEVERVSQLAKVETKCKQVLGKFKSECPDPSSFIYKCTMLKPKLYCLLSVSDVEKKRCKGIARAVVENDLHFSDFQDVFLTEQPRYDSQVSFRSRKHEIFVETVNKCSLSIQCIKRYWYDKQTSLPFGYPLTMKCTFCKQKYTTTDLMAEHDLVCLKNPFNLPSGKDREVAIVHYDTMRKVLCTNKSFIS